MEKKIYFISDLHLGLHPPEKSREREKMVVEWLDSIKDQAAELYLMGDIFDFWHEYKRVVPRGFTRFLGKIAELADNGVKIHFFTGNHDIWVYDYLPREIGLTLYRKPVVREINGLKFFLAHGDGIGPGDRSYKMLKAIFTNRILQWLFARLHPNFAVALGLTWSKKSRYAKGIVAEDFAGEEKEWQILFAREKLNNEHFDFFIFGHRHIPSDFKINNSRVINLGDWINNFSYAVLDGRDLKLHSVFPELEKQIKSNYL
ncbi:MAG: UDP-2,3-diacylglucosamine diphosphatase [Bacteroidetes bacterium]|jgi:UDP-2,3-diacylglucosamine hydrolase|nr:UDP-2,3-diacylglucosamine diphosphatase [Bacteroidota bacterium]